MAVETSGIIGSAGCSLLTYIGRHISRATNDPRQMFNIIQQISVAIIRGNANNASELVTSTDRTLILLIGHTTSLYLFIALLLLLYTQVFLRVQFLALCFSPCILSHCLPLLTHTLSYIIQFLMTYNYRCLLPQIEHLSYFTLLSHVYVMSKLGQLRTCLDLMTTMNAHVSNIARTGYFELRRLAYIRRFLTSTATATLVSAFVFSRIDYCNSLLFGSTHHVTSHL